MTLCIFAGDGWWKDKKLKLRDMSMDNRNAKTLSIGGPPVQHIQHSSQRASFAHDLTPPTTAAEEFTDKMSKRISFHVARHVGGRGVSFPIRRAPFSIATSMRAHDPHTDLLDALDPAKTKRPDPPVAPSRDPAFPSDSRNPFLNNFPKPRNNSDGGREMMIDTLQTLSRGSGKNSKGAVRRREKTLIEQDKKSLRTLELQMNRKWADGDVYAPHDLSPAEQKKARRVRMNPGPGGLQAGFAQNSRERDYLDEFNIDMRKEYTNVAMLSEFLTETGQIKHRRLTGLRPVNQRRVARAVRRAVAIGLMPSVHKHPELMPERRATLGLAPIEI